MAIYAATISVEKIEKFQVDGVERTAVVYAPEATVVAPLVFAFHGHGGGSAQAARSFRLHEHWPEAIVVYPQGLRTPTMRDRGGARPGWQNARGILGDRDLAFFDAMLKRFVKSAEADPKRVYAMGHSNGGRFTYLLWAERGAALAAVGPSAASGLSLRGAWVPKPAFIVAGEKDAIVPFDSQKRTIEAIRSLLGCDAAKARREGLAAYETGTGGVQLGTYVHAGGHVFPQRSGKAMVEFFKRQRLPG